MMVKKSGNMRHWLYAVIPVLLLLLAACGGTTSTTPTATATTAPTPTPTTAPTPTPTPTTAASTGPTQTVSITSTGGFAFDPATLTIPVGTTVTWKNLTSAPHTVTSDDGKTFDSGADKPLSPGGTFSFTFTTPGTYKYHCQFHSMMVATIIVQ